MKYRRYKKREKGQYWLPFQSFIDHFESVIICRYRDDYHTMAFTMESKFSNPLCCEMTLSKATLMNFSFVQSDKICNPANYKYVTLRTFMVGIPSEKAAVQNPVLLKASYHEPAKCVSVEAKLEAGKYRIVADVDGDTGEFGRAFVVIVHSRMLMFLQILRSKLDQ